MLAIGAETGASAAAGREHPRASLSRLVVTDFRSYTRAELLLDGRPVVLTGENGAGKTNLLEAVSLLSPGRGLRGAAYVEIAREGGAGGWAVAATLETGEGPVRLGTGLEPETEDRASTTSRSRAVRIDGAPASGAGALAQHLRIVWLTPAMDRLFLEGASERRRFLDRLVMGFDPAHGTRVNAYERSLRERNRLLAEEKMDPSWLGGLEEQMAAHGVAVAAARVDTLARLRGAIEAASEAHFPRADLALEGTLETALATAPAVDVEDAFRKRLAAARARDAAAGRSLEGPHRSDLLVRHVAKDREARLCSTGEQKALLIGIVLANARLLSARGHPPLLLLDEIAAHLDEQRRGALFDEIIGLNLQAFMTGTDPALFEAMGTRAQTFRIARGALLQIA
ncbi:MAG: DNA replication/repair protein RecF [Parvibaculum sp.]|uniref:DNA replication/repair protein RecF n=1 Tax=Parvibaculum sp. TaxID=2024848 RepID=UPI00284A7C3E|nr:DNA replication/repair protein RecF [Parvibaculum sp.]MDR3500775.1 DNA replication/repair protein RecF [Parvibaculum sp.]